MKRINTPLGVMYYVNQQHFRDTFVSHLHALNSTLMGSSLGFGWFDHVMRHAFELGSVFGPPQPHSEK